MRLYKFIPPVVFMLKKKFRNSDRETNTQTRNFSSYAEAESNCGGFGYEQDELVEIVFLKTKIFRDQLAAGVEFPITESMAQSLIGIFSVFREKSEKLNIIDFGGACGVHYFMHDEFLQDDILPIKWCVVDTPAMVKKAKKIETKELLFFDDITTAWQFLGEVDLLHSSGTLQYLPAPENALSTILNIDSSFVLLTRLAVSTGSQKIISIQESKLSTNGPGPLPNGIQDEICRYPVSYLPKDRLEKLLQKKYKIIMRFEETKLAVINNQQIISTGYFIQKI